MNISKSIFKKCWQFLPEIYFSLICLWGIIESIYWMISRNNFHISSIYLPLILLCIAMQYHWKSLLIAWVFSVILGFGSIYMILAVLSEFNEFQPDDPKGTQLLITGLLIFGISAIFAFAMPWKYMKRIE